MTEYVAECGSAPRDTVTARVDGDTVELAARRRGDYVMEAYLSPDKARTFARGIISLADAIDGGDEDPELKVQADDDKAQAIKAGDRVRVLYDRADGATVSAGDVFPVAAVSAWASGAIYVNRGDGRQWCFGPENVEKVDEPTKGEPIKVGDTIRVLRDSANGATVRRGDTFVVRHANDHEVQVDGDGRGGRWYLSLTNVEKVVDEPATAEAPSIAPERLALLDEARRMVGSRDIPQLLDMARFLAGE